MDKKEESILQSRQYEAALACFTAAFQLQAQQQRVNSNSILEYLGKGSLSTTAKYARIWHELVTRKSPEIAPQVQRAYEAALRGSDSADAPPRDTAPPLYIDFVERVTRQLAESLTKEAWPLTQMLVDQEIEVICQDADHRITDALAAKDQAEKTRDESVAKYKEHEAEREALRTQNTLLQQEASRLEGHLEELKVQRQEWDKKNDGLEQTVSEQSAQLIRLTLDTERYEEKLTESKQKEQKEYEKLIATEKTLKGMREVKEQLKERIARIEQNESILTSQLEQARGRIVFLEGKLDQQAAIFATLTGEARAAEERAKQLQVQVSHLQKI